MTRAAAVVATGRYLPKRLVTNDELRAAFAKSDQAEQLDRFAERSGIRQRYWAAPDEATSDLAVAAGQDALDRAGISADAIDLIILGTDTPDQITPATSVIVQAKLGATNAGTFDIGCACASFPTALANAAGLIAANPAIRRILVIGAYLMHRLADPADPMIFFYGDGAGAAVIEASDTPGVITSAFLADGRYARHWGIAAGGTCEPASHAAIDAGRTQVRLSERYPPEINENGWPALMQTLAAQGEFSLADIELAIFTQVNAETITHTCQTLGIDEARAPKLMDQYGYTGSACVPIALDHALREKTDIALTTLIGSGVGYNMAGVALKLDGAPRR